MISNKGAEPIMTEKPKRDRRQIRTKEMLVQALLSLIEERGMDGITVTDVANKANVNRGTFYLHYRDVTDMLDQLKDEVFLHIKQYVGKLDPYELRSYAEKEEPYPQIISIIEVVLTHANFFRVLFGPNGDLSFVLRFRKLMTTHIFNKLNYLMPQSNKQLVPPDYLVAYMSAANFGFFMHWIESGMQQTPYEVAKIATQIMVYGPIASSGIHGKPTFTPTVDPKK